jgi:hypothetical protein
VRGLREHGHDVKDSPYQKLERQWVAENIRKELKIA